MAVNREILKSIPYCSGLSPDELDSVEKFFFEIRVEKGNIILLEGDSAEAVYFVISGTVKLYKISAEGKEQILSILHPWQSFNEAHIFDGSLNEVSAQAMTPVVLYGINKSNLELMLQRYPQVSRNVIDVLTSQIRHLISLIEDLSFKHVTGRVAKILLEPAGDGAGRPRLTQQEMAAMAGTAREMVSRSLRALEEAGAIRFDRQRILITNKDMLKEMAGVVT